MTSGILIRDVVASEVADNNSELALLLKIFKADASGACEMLWDQLCVISAVSDSTAHTGGKERAGSGSYSSLFPKILQLECKK